MVWFSSWYVVSTDTGHIAQSPQSGPRCSATFKMEPVLSVSSRMRHVILARGRVGQIPSPYGVGGETGYGVPLIVTTWGKEECQGSGFSIPAF